MKPVKNISFRYFDVGDRWGEHLITGLVSCSDADSCRRQYTNFEKACGGYRRRVYDGFGQEACIFFTVADGVLASEQGGRPIV